MNGVADVPLRRRLSQAAVAVLCCLVGFGLVAQARATEEPEVRLEAEREEDLAQILAELSARSDALQAEITAHQLTLLEFSSSAAQDGAARRGLERRHDELRVLAGTVEVHGQGALITLEDPAREIRAELLVDVVQELRDAGAEAIGLNGVRLVASSYIAMRDQFLVVDDEPLVPPYRIVVIGPPDTIATAMAIRGGVVDTVERLEEASVSVETSSDLRLPAVREPPAFVHGTPVPDASDEE